jgi:Family of unknown function (DUF6174)
MKKFILITLILILTACSAGGSEFSQNQNKWQNANISHYRFQLNVGCFCAFRDKMPLTVEVQNGQIASMKYADGTQINADEQANFAQYATLDALFDYTAQRMKDAAEVKVTYDATYGYPTEVSIDGNKQIADDELYLSVSGFEKLQ